jgi:hypothetical protein
MGEKEFLMKKSLFALLFLSALAPAAFSQGIILRGGMNFAKAVTDPEPASPSNREFREGFNAALLGQTGDGPMSLLIGVGYENKGMHITGAGGGDIRLDYVTVPLMVSFGTGSPEGVAGPRLFLNVGAEPAFLVNSDYATDNFIYTFDNAEKFDISLRGEFGVEFPFSYSGPSGLIGLGYTYAMTDANSNNDEWRNYAFHLFAGLKFRTM